MRTGSSPTLVHLRAGIVALAVMALGSGSCSFIFVQPPHENLPDHGASECTTVAAAPMIDIILAGATAVGALYASQKNQAATSGASVPIGLSMAAIFTISSIYGFKHTSRCTELQSEPEEPVRPRPRRRVPVAPPPPANPSGP